MKRDFSKKVKKKIRKYKSRDFEFGKSKKYLSHRIKCSLEDIKRELYICKNLAFTERKINSGEERYTLYFVYSKTRGRAYALTFRKKIRVITAFPLGRRTLTKYNRKKFKKSR